MSRRGARETGRGGAAAQPERSEPGAGGGGRGRQMALR